MRRPTLFPLGALAIFALAPSFAQTWRTADDRIDGWDWSLPPAIEPAARSGLYFEGKAPEGFKGKRLEDLRWSWQQIEPEEGSYDFESLRKEILAKSAGIDGVMLHVYSSTWQVEITIKGRKKLEQVAAPRWLVTKYHVPVIAEEPKTNLATPFTVYNLDISHPIVRDRYLKMMRAFGQSPIPKMPQVKFVYVQGVSSSRGEEWSAMKKRPSPEVMKERFKAWADAFKGQEYKLAWVGGNADLLQSAYDLGMGQRGGFIEMYLYNIPNPALGQLLDREGYLVVDETVPPIKENRAFGDENEEYSSVWVPRYGPLETFPHRYRESMLRALQMRRNFLWAEPNPWVDHALLNYVALELGRTIQDTPDIWCYLRESYVGQGGKATPVKNFERWLYQRDRDGVRTEPAVQVKHPMKKLNAAEGYGYDMIARRAVGDGRIGFAVDDRFLPAGPHRVAFKITYHDQGEGAWTLRYQTPHGPVTRTFSLSNSGKIETVTCFAPDAVFEARDMNFDFVVESKGGNPPFSFVRVIRL